MNRPKKIFLSILFISALNVAWSQSRFTLNGYVRDSISGELIIGATIIASNSGSVKGVSSNQYGFYSITLDEGNYVMSVSHISYQTKIIPLNLKQNASRNLELIPKTTITEAVVIYTKRRDANVKNPQMGKVDLSIEKIKTIPAFLGEIDILKAIQLLPGVRNAGEGNAGFYVRGGGPDQNLIILDDATVYNAFHLFGFFSLFNGDALKSVELTKGGFPARYGGRLSSVLDMQMKDGNKEKIHGEGGIGIVSSRLTLEGPVRAF